MIFGAAIVRAAGRADLAGVLALYRSFSSYDPAFDAAAAETAWSALVASGLVTVVVAVVDGVIASTCTLTVIPNLTWRGRPYAIIENVVTDPARRRSGLGRGVLAFATERAWAAGCY